MLSKMKLCLILTALIGLQACVSNRVSTDYQAGYDFSQLKTYYVIKNTDGPDKKDLKVSSIDLQRIEKNIKSVLESRFSQQEKPGADFWVRYGMVIDEKSDVSSFHTSFGQPYYCCRFGVTLSDVQTVHYQEGNIIVDIINPANEEVIWRGVSKGKVTPNLAPSKRESQIHEALVRLFAQFPPQIK